MDGQPIETSLGRGQKPRNELLGYPKLNGLLPFVLVIYYFIIFIIICLGFQDLLKTALLAMYLFLGWEVVMKERIGQKETSPFSFYNRIIGPLDFSSHLGYMQ